jgi:predicted SAM-dependent methyltransferase
VGWVNIDNSWTVRLARIPGAVRLLAKIGVLSSEQAAFADTAAQSNLRWGDATRRLPFEDGSVGVLYTSHMLEHLDPSEALDALKEVHRVLGRDGIIRIVVPDLAVLAARYRETRDADAFVRSTQLAAQKPHRLLPRLKQAFLGDRGHHWMYDGLSMCRLLESVGFIQTVVLPAGRTTIPDPGALDLFERSDGSLYVEARKA